MRSFYRATTSHPKTVVLFFLLFLRRFAPYVNR